MIEKTLFLTRNLKFQKVEDFKVQSILGSGCNGIVFHCLVELNGECFSVAVKMILNLHGMTTNTLRAGAFENEFMILYRLKAIHPNVIHILSDFISEPSQQMVDFTLQIVDKSIQDLLFNTNLRTGEKTMKKTQFFVTELHPITLQGKLDQLGMEISTERILKYSLEIVDCFLFLFNNHIAHRDVKLDNIFVSAEDRIILGDFGESVELDQFHRCQQIKLGGGNQMFTAPEVLNSISQAKAEDWIEFKFQFSWEVGCLLFFISFGEFPFLDYPAAFGKAPNIEVPAVAFPEGEHIPSELKEVIAALLLNEAEERMELEEAFGKLKKMTGKC